MKREAYGLPAGQHPRDETSTGAEVADPFSAVRWIDAPLRERWSPDGLDLEGAELPTDEDSPQPVCRWPTASPTVVIADVLVPAGGVPRLPAHGYSLAEARLSGGAYDPGNLIPLMETRHSVWLCHAPSEEEHVTVLESRRDGGPSVKPRGLVCSTDRQISQVTRRPREEVDTVNERTVQNDRRLRKHANGSGSRRHRGTCEHGAEGQRCGRILGHPADARPTRAPGLGPSVDVVWPG